MTARRVHAACCEDEVGFLDAQTIERCDERSPVTAGLGVGHRAVDSRMNDELCVAGRGMRRRRLRLGVKPCAVRVTAGEGA